MFRPQSMRFFANLTSLLVGSANASSIEMVVRESAFERLVVNRSDAASVDAGDTQTFNTELKFTDGSLTNLPPARRLQGPGRAL